jgi:hypothetical protein
MPQETLSLATLHETVRGGIGRAFDQAMKKVVADLHDRPELNKARTVTLKVKFVPKGEKSADGQFQLVHADVSMAINTSMPEQAAIQYAMKPRPDGTLVFATESPDDPNQFDIKDVIREQAREGIRTPPQAGPKLAGG